MTHRSGVGGPSTLRHMASSGDVLKAIDSLDDKQKRYVENIGRSGRMLTRIGACPSSDRCRRRVTAS